MIIAKPNDVLYVTLLLSASMMLSSGFAPTHGAIRTVVSEGGRRGDTLALHMVAPLDLNTFTTAVVDVFDGSGIDPVVVSDAFWSRLAGSFISVMIGNFLAALVFAFIMSQASAQLSKLGSFVTESIFKGEKGSIGGGSRASTTSTFRRADEVSAVNIDFGKLLLCIAIDVVGSASELVPVLGEVTDVVWAPIAGLALRSIFGSNILFALEFTEEILPFTDILPLATLCWVVDTFFSDSDLAKALGLGKASSTGISSNAIDVEATSETSSRLLEGDAKKRR